MVKLVLCVLLAILLTMSGHSNVVSRPIREKMCQNYPPSPTNVTCRVSGSETMTCSWSLGVNMSCTSGIINDNIATLYYKSDDEYASWATCPQQKNTYCYWNSEVFTDPWKLFVKVTVNSEVYNATSETDVLTFYQDDIFEPGPVTDLKMTMTSEPRCAELDWVPSHPLRSFRFIVSYTSSCTDTMEISVYYNGTSRSFIDIPIVCNLNPYTDCTFRVQGRLMKDFHNATSVEQGYWSQANILVAHTDADVPDANPITFAGLYEILSITRPAMEDYSFLTLYWAPLSDCNLHDDPGNVMYYITAHNRTKSVQHPAASTHIDVPNHKVLNITLHAGNSAGSANSRRELAIFPASFAPTPSELIVEYKTIDENCLPVANVMVNENRTAYSDIFHTLVWCKGTQQSCQEPVKWKELTRNETLFTLPGNPCVDVYRYGLVTHGYNKGQGRNVDTGIYWEPCIYQTATVPEDPPENVHLPKVQPRKGFTVEWTLYDCKVTKAYITHYNVTYCIGGGKETCKCFEDAVTDLVPRQSNSYTASGLVVGSRVCVWVRGISKAGMGPPNTNSISLTISDRTSGFENILVLTDHFSRYAQAFPTRNQTAKTTARILFDNFVVHYGFPARIHSDQGRNFESNLIKELCNIAGTEKTRTTPYHSMGNGMVERFNQTLLKMLGTLEDNQKADWKAHVPSLVHAYNATHHDSTGFSPYFLMFGRHPRLAIDAFLGLPTDNRSSSKHTEYVVKLRDRLHSAYAKARQVAERTSATNKDEENVVIIAMVSVAIAGGAMFTVVIVISCLYKRYKHIRSNTNIIIPPKMLHEDSSKPMIGSNDTHELSGIDTSSGDKYNSSTGTTSTPYPLGELDKGIHDKDNKDSVKSEDFNEAQSYLNAVYDRCNVTNHNVKIESQNTPTNPVAEEKVHSNMYISNDAVMADCNDMPTYSMLAKDEHNMEEDQFDSLVMKGDQDKQVIKWRENIPDELIKLQAKATTCDSQTEYPQNSSNESIELKDKATPDVCHSTRLSIECQWETEEDIRSSLEHNVGDGNLGEVENESINICSDSAPVELDSNITNMHVVGPDTMISQNKNGYCMIIH